MKPMSGNSRPITPNLLFYWRDKILSECIGEEPPPCQAACPLEIRVREKIRLIQAGDLKSALAVVLERCPFPGILGRICAHPCESACTRGKVDQSLAIAALKRYVADLDPEALFQVSPGPERPERVAVVGGGPAGLMAAFELRRLGYGVTLFEAEPYLGGALRLYIPPYRLPREVLEREVSLVVKMGAEVRLGTRLGRDIQLEDLRRDFAAVFLALGTHKSLRLQIPGEDLEGVYPGLDFLRRANCGEPLAGGRRVAVIGGGNVAVDAARTARRLGAGEVTLVCLEALAEMPASPWEVEEAGQEGVKILDRWGVKRILGENGKAVGLQLKAVSRVFDADGRFAPEFLEDRLSEVQADLVLVAIGQVADFGFFGPGLAFDTSTDRRHEADPVTLQSSIPGVFAGGDLVSGPRTAVEAFAAGRRAAVAIDCFLCNTPLPENLPPLGSRTTDLIVNTTGISPAPRLLMPRLEIKTRLAEPQAEVDLGYTPEAAAAEAARCLSCTCSQCVQNCTFLQHYVPDYPHTGKEFVRILRARGEAEPRIPYSCQVCGLCQAVCPKELDVGLACREFREHLCDTGRGPLPQHKGTRNFVKWGTSPTFALSRPDPATGKARRIFFPGCNLPGHSPHLVKAAYAYLREKLPDTGIMLNCCGAPSDLLGEKEVLNRLAAGVAAEMARLGADELITACTYCLFIIRQHRPEIKTRSLYEVMLERGLPPGAKTGKSAVFNVHDSCGARQSPPIQEAVRRLLQEAGHRYEEMLHCKERSICCGSGGMAPAVDAALTRKMTEFRLSEASFDLVTYCASCRARLAGAGHPALHLLELIFNPDWEQAKTAPPAGPRKRWWRRWRLERYFQGL
jgi:NADPH-dependent glutamate synthase beta subunit-like oxidoreductase